jgi:nucleotide-binding universal stress UspA family protein
MHILVSSDGEETLSRAVDYTLLFADQAAVTLLSTYENDSDRPAALDTLDHLAEKIDLVSACPVQAKAAPGEIIPAVLHEIQSRDYDLVVFGSHLTPRLRKIRPKKTARKIAKRVTIPLLVVLPEWEKLEKILVCIGGTEPDGLVLRLSGKLASAVDAHCTVLHVMSQIPLRADAEQEDLERDAQALIKHESKEGGYLENAMQILEQQGVEHKQCDFRVRHGLTVEEIIRESQEGAFDLVVIGGLEVPPEKSWQELRELVQEDIADQVLTQANRPVLIAHNPKHYALEWEDF